MARRIARVGDAVRFVCVRDSTTIVGTGRIVQGSPDVNADGSPVARSGDLVDCGQCGMGEIRATSTSLANGTPIAAEGDDVVLKTFPGRGTVVEGSPNSTTD